MVPICPEALEPLCDDVVRLTMISSVVIPSVSIAESVPTPFRGRPPIFFQILIDAQNRTYNRTGNPDLEYSD